MALQWNGQTVTDDGGSSKWHQLAEEASRQSQQYWADMEEQERKRREQEAQWAANQEELRRQERVNDAESEALAYEPAAKEPEMYTPEAPKTSNDVNAEAVTQFRYPGQQFNITGTPTPEQPKEQTEPVPKPEQNSIRTGKLLGQPTIRYNKRTDTRLDKGLYYPAAKMTVNRKAEQAEPEQAEPEQTTSWKDNLQLPPNLLDNQRDTTNGNGYVPTTYLQENPGTDNSQPEETTTYKPPVLPGAQQIRDSLNPPDTITYVPGVSTPQVSYQDAYDQAVALYMNQGMKRNQAEVMAKQAVDKAYNKAPEQQTGTGMSYDKAYQNAFRAYKLTGVDDDTAERMAKNALKRAFPEGSSTTTTVPTTGGDAAAKSGTQKDLGTYLKGTMDYLQAWMRRQADIDKRKNGGTKQPETTTSTERSGAGAAVDQIMNSGSNDESFVRPPDPETGIPYQQKPGNYTTETTTGGTPSTGTSNSSTSSGSGSGSSKKAPENSVYFRPSYGQDMKYGVKAPYRKEGYSLEELESYGNVPRADYKYNNGKPAYEGYYLAPNGKYYPVDQQKAAYYRANGGSYQGWDEGMREYYDTFGTFYGYRPGWKNTGKIPGYSGGGGYSYRPSYGYSGGSGASVSYANQNPTYSYNGMKNWSF